MKFFIVFVMAVVVVITYPVKIIIQESDALAAKINLPRDAHVIFHGPEKKKLIPMGPRSQTIDPTTLISVDQDEISCLALNIYFEAAVESTAGKLAVAHVTHNRVSSRYFPNSYCNVIYEGIHHANGFPKRDRCQFSWYCDGRYDSPYPGPTWQKVQDLANYYYKNANDLRDITDGATHYHADYIDSPRWALLKKKTVQIDTHIFYR
jgi:spore germination cell wall hydrolase CwlJ-like protein